MIAGKWKIVHRGSLAADADWWPLEVAFDRVGVSVDKLRCFERRETPAISSASFITTVLACPS
jgi:hypothetical protein